jgi:hypothetical protein
MKAVEFIRGHAVEQAQHCVDAGKVAGNVEHHAAVGIARRILHRAQRQRAIGREQLRQALQAVEDPVRAGAREHHALTIDVERIRFIPRFGDRPDGERHRALARRQVGQ